MIWLLSTLLIAGARPRRDQHIAGTGLIANLHATDLQLRQLLCNTCQVLEKAMDGAQRQPLLYQRLRPDGPARTGASG